MSTHLRDFTRMNPFMFFVYKVDKELQEFLHEFYKILLAMGVITTEKVELATYQLKDVSLTWYYEYKDSMSLRGGPLTWEIFKKAFPERFFPREQRESKFEEFINLRQGGMSVKEYSLTFVKV